MKKSLLLAFALSAAMLGSIAHADRGGNGNGNNGNGNGNGGPNTNPSQVVGGISVSGFAGYVTGTASSETIGNSVAVTNIAGTGTSFQHTDGFGAGQATVGGIVNSQGAQVTTVTTQTSQVNSYGTVTGNAPATTGGLTSNGTGGLAQVTNYAHGTGQFATGAIGGQVAINGFQGFQFGN